MNGSRKAVLLHWEELRIGYNLVLLVEVLWALRAYPISVFAQFWYFVLLFAVGANVLFLLGPLSELGVRALLGERADRTRNRSLLAFRYALFSAGLVFSMWLALDMTLIFEFESNAYYESCAPAVRCLQAV